MWLDSIAYFPGNSVLAKLEANNTSVKNTTALYVKVYRHVHLKAHGHTKNVSAKVYEQRYPGFEPSWYGVRFLPFQIPVNLPPSSRASSRVNSRYEFIVECEISGALNLRTVLDCTIVAPQFMFATSQPALPPLAHVPNEVSFRPPWQPDEARNNCNKCAGEFGLFNRRHHCRHCGLLMCSKCVPERAIIPNLGYDEEPVLVCLDCMAKVRESGGKHYQEAPQWVVSWRGGLCREGFWICVLLNHLPVSLTSMWSPSGTALLLPIPRTLPMPLRPIWRARCPFTRPQCKQGKKNNKKTLQQCGAVRVHHCVCTRRRLGSPARECWAFGAWPFFWWARALQPTANASLPSREDKNRYGAIMCASAGRSLPLIFQMGATRAARARAREEPDPQRHPRCGATQQRAHRHGQRIR